MSGLGLGFGLGLKNLGIAKDLFFYVHDIGDDDVCKVLLFFPSLSLSHLLSCLYIMLGLSVHPLSRGLRESGRKNGREGFFLSWRELR
jgi:hypothetical protein